MKFLADLCDELGKDLPISLPSLLFWLDGVAKKSAFSLSVSLPFSLYLVQLGRSLNILARDTRFTTLKRRKKNILSLVMCSKSCDYTLIGDKWNVDCKACEMDLEGWVTGDKVWDYRFG